MTNTKIIYKILTLPEKHLFKSEIHRHDKLRNYLTNLISIKGIHEVYSVNSFFNVSSNTNLDDLSFSEIEVSEKEIERQSKKKVISEQYENSPSVRGVSLEDSSFSSNQRMSALIDELGN